MHVGREAFGDGDLLDDSADATDGETSATLVDQQGGCGFFLFSEELLTGGQVGAKSGDGRSAEGHVALFLPFSANQNRLGADADVVEIDADQLRVADAATVEQFEKESVALWEGGNFGHVAIEYRVHFFDGWHARQFFGQLWRGDELGGILFDDALLCEPTVERADGGEGACDRGSTQPFFVEVREESANRDVVDALPVA